MGKYDGWMLISDIDGTLLPRGGVVSEENKEAVKEFVAGGGRFGVATGRTPEAAAGYVKDLPINAPCVFFNGAMLWDWERGEAIATRPLPASDAWPRFAADAMRMLPKACVEVYTWDNCHVVSPAKNDDPRLPHEYYRYAHTPLAGLSDMAATPWLKFFVCDAPPALSRLVRSARHAGLYELAHGFYSEHNYYEFVAKGTSKGAMLEKVRELPGFEGVKIIAAGDFTNDNELLREADIGVAPSSAHESTRAAADLVGCAVEEHLMRWILEHVFS